METGAWKYAVYKQPQRRWQTNQLATATTKAYQQE
jgi:hypothetical protein